MDTQVRSSPVLWQTPFLVKMFMNVLAQMVERLTSKCDTLRSNSSTALPKINASATWEAERKIESLHLEYTNATTNGLERKSCFLIKMERHL
jgi:hypothetical protein